MLLDGKDVAEGDPALLRRGIGYVIQHAGLFPHRTVLDNIATVPLLSGWDKAKARKRAAELLESSACRSSSASGTRPSSRAASSSASASPARSPRTRRCC